MNKPLTIALSALLIGGCSSTTGVHPIGGEQYFISEGSAQRLFGPPIIAEHVAYQSAQEFCESQGKNQVITTTLDVQNALLQTPGRVNLTFSCGSKAQENK